MDVGSLVLLEATDFMSDSEQRTGVLPTAPVPGPLGGGDDEEPPSKPNRHSMWQDVSDSKWNDWHWQSQNAIRSVRQLRDLLPFTPDELEAMGRLEGEYKLAIPPYYFSLIDPTDPNDPIRLQSVTSPLEAENPSGFELEDPLEEDKDSPVPGLTHRYPDRVLMVTTHVCTMYCRFCTRKRATMVRGGWDAINRNDERMIEYVRSHPEIHDVIVSGGDPLTLPLAKLKFFLDHLKAIPHVEVVRIGTRVPVTLPQRLYDPELIDLLASAEKVWIQTHFNHPREITPEAERVCKTLLRAGMPLNNHIVLLKGVNDDLATMRRIVPLAVAHQGPTLLLVPLRSGDRRRTFPHVGVERSGTDGRVARAYFRLGHSHLCRGQPARRRQDPADAELSGIGQRRRGHLAQLRGHARSLSGRGQAADDSENPDPRRQRLVARQPVGAHPAAYRTLGSTPASPDEASRPAGRGFVLRRIAFRRRSQKGRRPSSWWTRERR